MKKVTLTNSEVIVEHEPHGLNGKGAITIAFPTLGQLKLRMTLEDAETLGDALVYCVRSAEEDTTP